MLDVSSDRVQWNYSRPSVRTSLIFLKTGSLAFSDIVPDDSWPLYLVTNEARFLKKKKKNWRPGFGPKSGPKLGFLLFSQIWFTSFLLYCIVKTQGKKLGTQNWAQNYNSRHFLKVASLVFLDIAEDCNVGECLISSIAETSKKNFCGLS